MFRNIRKCLQVKDMMTCHFNQTDDNLTINDEKSNLITKKC